MEMLFYSIANSVKTAQGMRLTGFPHACQTVRLYREPLVSHQESVLWYEGIRLMQADRRIQPVELMSLFLSVLFVSREK